MGTAAGDPGPAPTARRHEHPDQYPGFLVDVRVNIDVMEKILATAERSA